MTHDNEQLAVVVLRQERGAVCQLLDTQSEVGGLVFRFGTNGQVHHVYYGLSDTRLRSEKEVEEFLADRNRSQELSLSDGAEEFALNLTVCFLLRPITCTCFRFIVPETLRALT